MGKLAEAEDVPTWMLQELGGWKNGTMVRRYAHMSVKHLQPYADQLIFPDTPELLVNPAEKLESPSHKNGHSEGHSPLGLVVGADLSCGFFLGLGAAACRLHCRHGGQVPPSPRADGQRL